MKKGFFLNRKAGTKERPEPPPSGSEVKSSGFPARISSLQNSLETGNLWSGLQAGRLDDFWAPLPDPDPSWTAWGKVALVGELCPSCPRVVWCPRRAVVPAEPPDERASAWAWHWPRSPGHVTRGPDRLWLATPSRPRARWGAGPGASVCSGLGAGRGVAEGERGEEDPAFSSSSLPGQRPAGSGSSLPRRHRHRPGPRPAAATRPEPLSARSSRGSKAGLSNSQLFFCHILKMHHPWSLLFHYEKSQRNHPAGSIRRRQPDSFLVLY